jgi:phage antirepressor YoqD-like protein
MQLLESNTKTVTMTSLELVDYINEQREPSSMDEPKNELRHDHFMDKVLKVLGADAAPNFRATYFDAQNKERPCYKLPKREACLMAMSYSYELQAKVFDKMTALESKPKTALQLAREQVFLHETIEKQTLQLAAQAPAVAFVEKFVEAKSSKCLSDVAKILGKNPHAFIKQLSDDHVIFKRGGNWLPAQSRIDNGHFTVKTGTASGHAYEQTRVEPKGIEWLARVYG